MVEEEEGIPQEAEGVEEVVEAAADVPEWPRNPIMSWNMLIRIG
jgi:hypothetical protein